jgi:hypothetical protein
VSHYEPLGSLAAVLRRVAALVCLSGLVTVAHAQSNVAAGPLATSIANGYVFSYSPSGQPVIAPARSYIAGPDAGSVIARDSVRLNQPGAGFNAQVARTIPWANTARAVAGAAMRALPWVSTAVAVCGLLDSAGFDCPPGGGAQLDPGAAQQSYTLRRGTGSFAVAIECQPGQSGTGRGTTVTAAADDLVSKLAASKSSCTYTSGTTQQSLSWTFRHEPCGASSCTIVRTQYQTSTYANGSIVNFSPSNATTTVAFSTVTESQCPPNADGTFPSPYRDGSCPTETRIVPTEVQLGDVLTARGEQLRVVDVVDELVRAGHPVTAPDPATVTGPASIVGSTTTTTTPTGTETRTTEYMFDYGPDRVTWGRVETGTDSSGNTSSTTTTGTDNAEDGPGLCELYPDILACAKLGEAPDDVVPTATREVDFEPVDLGSSGCPGPIDLGDGQTFSYEPLCDNLQMVRPLIIAVGFVMAALIIVNALRA